VEVELQQLQRAPAHAQQRRALRSKVHLRRSVSAAAHAPTKAQQRARLHRAVPRVEHAHSPRAVIKRERAAARSAARSVSARPTRSQQGAHVADSACTRSRQRNARVQRRRLRGGCDQVDGRLGAARSARRADCRPLRDATGRASVAPLVGSGGLHELRAAGAASEVEQAAPAQQRRTRRVVRGGAHAQRARSPAARARPRLRHESRRQLQAVLRRQHRRRTGVCVCVCVCTKCVSWRARKRGPSPLNGAGSAAAQ
jgi:hypothetical protein